MLKPSNDSKTRCRESQQNTYGLMPGTAHTCPFATEGEGGCFTKTKGGKSRVCYAYKLMRARPNVRKVMEHNTNLLKNMTESQMVDTLVAEFERFKEGEKGNKERHKIYRLHWSGDIFSQEYANAITTAISKCPEVQFWTYTRSFNYITDDMIRLPNLTLYLSVDKCNIDKAISWYRDKMKEFKYSPSIILPGIGYMGVEVDERISDFAKEIGLIIHQCPTDTGELEQESACSKCRKCVLSKNYLVYFKTR